MARRFPSTSTSSRLGFVTALGLSCALLMLLAGAAVSVPAAYGQLWNQPPGTNDIYYDSGYVTAGGSGLGFPLGVDGKSRFTDSIWLSDGKAFGRNPDGENFSYDGLTIPHYGVVWDQGNSTSNPVAHFSGFDGVNLYTEGIPRVRINRSGDVGIGTTSPERLLHTYGGTAVFDLDGHNGNGIVGRISLSTPAGDPGIVLYRADTDRFDLINRGNYFTLGYNEDGAYNGAGLSIVKGGNVGVGTSSPEKRLTVDGHIGATEVIVQPSWADFVFEEDYDLPTLGEVKAHIELEGHLPGIPSAGDVERDGVALGAMDAKLLQKIEELTLYVLDQRDTIDALQTQNETLNTVNAQFRAGYAGLQQQMSQLVERIQSLEAKQ